MLQSAWTTERGGSVLGDEIMTATRARADERTRPVYSSLDVSLRSAR